MHGRLILKYPHNINVFDASVLRHSVGTAEVFKYEVEQTPVSATLIDVHADHGMFGSSQLSDGQLTLEDEIDITRCECQRATYVVKIRDCCSAGNNMSRLDTLFEEVNNLVYFAATKAGEANQESIGLDLASGTGSLTILLYAIQRLLLLHSDLALEMSEAELCNIVRGLSANYPTPSLRFSSGLAKVSLKTIFNIKGKIVVDKELDTRGAHIVEVSAGGALSVNSQPSWTESGVRELLSKIAFECGNRYEIPADLLRGRLVGSADDIKAGIEYAETFRIFSRLSLSNYVAVEMSSVVGVDVFRAAMHKVKENFEVK
jgi:hypothetical protein